MYIGIVRKKRRIEGRLGCVLWQSLFMWSTFFLNLCTCMCVCMCVFVCRCICTCACAQIRACVCFCICVLHVCVSVPYLCFCVCLCVCMCVHLYAFTGELLPICAFMAFVVTRAVQVFSFDISSSSICCVFLISLHVCRSGQSVPSWLLPSYVSFANPEPNAHPPTSAKICWGVRNPPHLVVIAHA